MSNACHGKGKIEKKSFVPWGVLGKKSGRRTGQEERCNNADGLVKRNGSPSAKEKGGGTPPKKNPSGE